MKTCGALNKRTAQSSEHSTFPEELTCDTGASTRGGPPSLVVVPISDIDGDDDVSAGSAAVAVDPC